MSLMPTDAGSLTAHVPIDHDAILKAFGINARDPKAQAMILACEKYGLDPLLKHALLISGNLYVTRDGLLHVAHRSGRLNGIVVEDEGDTAQEWWAKVTVYVKGQDHGYTYRGRYPKNGQQKKYGPEMAVKVAEVMALRRAFGVTGIATVEEQWDKQNDYTGLYDQPERVTAEVMPQVSGGGDAGTVPPAGVASPGVSAPDRQAPATTVEPALFQQGEVGTAPLDGTAAVGGEIVTGGGQVPPTATPSGDTPATLKETDNKRYQSLNRFCRAVAGGWDEDVREPRWEALAYQVSGGRSTHLGELTPEEAQQFRARIEDGAKGRAHWVESDDPKHLGWTLEAGA